MVLVVSISLLQPFSPSLLRIGEPVSAEEEYSRSTSSKTTRS
jgi:hypothetical protein